MKNKEIRSIENMVNGLGFKQIHAHVKSIYESGDEFASDNSLVWVQRIPTAVSEDGELVWKVEFVHEDIYREYKTSELVKWWEV